MLLSASEAANHVRPASKYDASDCVLEKDETKKEKNLRKTQSFFILLQQTMNHADMLFMCVCVCIWKIRMYVRVCISRFPGLPRLAHHSEDDREWDTSRSSCSDKFHT